MLGLKLNHVGKRDNWYIFSSSQVFLISIGTIIWVLQLQSTGAPFTNMDEL